MAPPLIGAARAREMKRLLSSEIGPVRTGGARRHQGLIHLYKSTVASQPA